MLTRKVKVLSEQLSNGVWESIQKELEKVTDPEEAKYLRRKLIESKLQSIQDAQKVASKVMIIQAESRAATMDPVIANASRVSFGLSLTGVTFVGVDQTIAYKGKLLSKILGNLIHSIKEYDPCMTYAPRTFVGRLTGAAPVCAVHKGKWVTAIIGNLQNAIVISVKNILKTLDITGEALIDYTFSLIRLCCLLGFIIISILIIASTFASLRATVKLPVFLGGGTIEFDSRRHVPLRLASNIQNSGRFINITNAANAAKKAANAAKKAANATTKQEAELAAKKAVKEAENAARAAKQSTAKKAANDARKAATSAATASVIAAVMNPTPTNLNRATKAVAKVPPPPPPPPPRRANTPAPPPNSRNAFLASIRNNPQSKLRRVNTPRPRTNTPGPRTNTLQAKLAARRRAMTLTNNGSNFNN